MAAYGLEFITIYYSSVFLLHGPSPLSQSGALLFPPRTAVHVLNSPAQWMRLCCLSNELGLEQTFSRVSTAQTAQANWEPAVARSTQPTPTPSQAERHPAPAVLQTERPERQQRRIH